MRQLLSILFCVSCYGQIDLQLASIGEMEVGVKTFYVNSGGNDSNNGMAAAQAWQTIGRVNTAMAAGTLSPGTRVLFNRGDVFDGELNVTVQGSASHPVFFGAYGAGANPIINAAGEDYGIVFAGMSYLSFSSLTVTGATSVGINSTTGNKNGIIISDCVSSDNGLVGMDLRLVDGLVISNCSCSNSASYYGLELRGVTNATITGLVALYNANSGLRILSSDATQSGGIMISNAVLCGNGDNGISIGPDTGTGAVVTVYNTIAATNAVDGFNVHGDWSGVVFDGCTADSNGVDGVGGDGDGFSFHETSSGTIRYSIAKDNKKTSVANISTSSVNHYYNLFYGVTNGTQANVLIADTGNHTFYNNVIYSAAQGGTGVSLAGTNIFKNNIVMGFATGISKGTGTLTEDYNCAFGAGTTNYSGFALGANSIQLDPDFTSVATRDFTLAVGSPCINDGVDVSLSRDFVGNPINGTPDMGAYEKQ